MSLRDLFWPLLGNWSGTEQQAASPWAPASTARAMIVFKLDVADQVVVQDYRQVRADGAEFSAHGVFMLTEALLDPGEHELGWWIFDSYGEPPQPATGGWHGGELIMEKWTVRGVARHTFAPDQDRLSYRIETRLGDAPYFTEFLTGTYARISGH